MREFTQNPLTFLEKKRELGLSQPIQRIFLGPRPFVLVFDAAVAMDILTARSSRYGQNKAVFSRITPVTGKKGMVQLEGAESRALRLKSRPLFSSQALESAREITLTYALEAVKKIPLQTPVDISKEMTSLILQTALNIFLGVDDPASVRELGEQFLLLNQICGRRMLSLFPPPLFFPTSQNRKVLRLQRNLRRIISSLAAKGSSGARITALTVFRNDPTFVDQCLTLLFAGHETSASSLAFTFLLLGQHPQYQEEVAFGPPSFTQAVYQESLRLFPPAYMLVREALSDDVLGGVSLKKGDQVIIGLQQIQRHPVYYPDPQYPPQVFYPHRPRGLAFFPFGAGPKSCLGDQLAYLEAGLVLKTFCRHFVMETVQESITTRPLITLHPGDRQEIIFSFRGGP